MHINLQEHCFKGLEQESSTHCKKTHEKRVKKTSSSNDTNVAHAQNTTQQRNTLQAARMIGNIDVFGDTKKSWTATFFFFFWLQSYEIVALEYNLKKKREKKVFV